ncbi:MAG: restriction endonuclease [Ardenticatenales bacterium]|nr:restriction endonuclease [Ardenticatenales bacterium]
MRTLRLREHATSFGVALSPDEVDELRRTVSSVDVQPTPGLRHRFDVRPGATVGIVRLGDLSVEIQPKLPIRRLLFLLSYLVDPKGWRPDETEVDEGADLFEAVIPAFAFQVYRALRRGVLQGYRTEEDALSVVRGRVRFDDQIRRRYGRTPPVEVRYDEFTEDIEANRLIKAATRRLLRLRPRSLASRRSLAGIEVAFAAVSDVTYRARDLQEIPYNRLNAHYRPAVELARLILRATSLEVGHGAVRGMACLFDMNVVFEDFVVVALREQLRLSTHTFPQGASGHRLCLDNDRRIRLEPDISWWEGERAVFVGDVKYKRTADALGRNADIYQAMAYAIAADLPGALLIYAAGEREQGVHRIIHLDKVIEVVTMDLNARPEVVLGLVQAIAERIRALQSAQG